MKTRSLALFTFGLFLTQIPVVCAQAVLDPSLVPHPYSTLKTLTNYQPSVLASEADALTVFKAMPTTIFKSNSQCYQRAEVWATQLFSRFQLTSMKVMILFTARYQREFGYAWDYHIAPLMPVQMNDGSIQDLVFDPTFVTDGKAISIHDWSRYFIYPDVDCLPIDNYADYLNFQDRAYCYVMKVPMYNYIPDNLEYFNDPSHFQDQNLWYNPTTQMRINFRPSDLQDMKNGLK
jgi:hypothetical protein